jgi:hypothetical protein
MGRATRLTSISWNAPGGDWEVSHRVYQEQLVRDLDTNIKAKVVQVLAEKMADKIMAESGPLVMKALSVEALIPEVQNHLMTKIVEDFLHGKGTK